MKAFFLLVLGSVSGVTTAISLSSTQLASAATYWGGETPLSPAQMVRAENLAFPQSAEAMRFLGVPKWRNRRSDWFPLARGGYLRVDFDRRGRAKAISWEQF